MSTPSSYTPYPFPGARDPDGRPRRRAMAPRHVVLHLAAFLVAGVLCGALWAWAWDAPTGVAFRGEWVLVGPDVANAFNATGWYVAIAAGAGLVLGVVTMLLHRSDELVALLLLVVGAAVAAALMGVVGHALGPGDPDVAAREARNGTEIPADLSVEGASAYTAFPLAALTGAVVVLIAAKPRS